MLFKKVSKGVYPRIPACYSEALENIIAKCLQQDPNKRPSAKKILQMIPEEASLLDYNP
jgi:serine/threonine protein kinase